MTIELTADQKVVITQIGEFLSGDGKIFLLKGSAGTGKTTILRIITQLLREKEILHTLMAPTGKAAKVISERTGEEARTIHSSIYQFDKLVEIKDFSKSEDEDDATPMYCFKPKDCPGSNIIIVDEASMIGNEYSDSGTLRFGSGYLLDDLINYSGVCRDDINSKIIFVGDPFQLSPIGSGHSVALDAYWLEDFYDVEVHEGELLTPVRFGENSGILDNAVNLRDRLVSGVIGNIKLTENKNCQFFPRSESITGKYLETLNSGEDCVMIASTNSATHLYNMSVRESILGENTALCVDEKLMIVQNSHFTNGVVLLNGDAVIVREVFEAEKRSVRMKNGGKILEVELNFRDIEIGIPRFPVEIRQRVTIIEDLLFGNERDLSRNQIRALYVDFIQRNRDLKSGTSEFAVKLANDNRFNALRVKFCHAITCHKAQGSEWNTVFLDPVTFHNKLSKELVRWLYTAVTRAKSKLFLYDDNFSMSNTSLSFTDGNPEIVAVRNVPATLRPIEILKTGVTGFIKDHGFAVEEVVELQWRLRCTVTSENEKQILDVIHNSGWKITSVQIDERYQPGRSISNKRLKEAGQKLINKAFRMIPEGMLLESGTPTLPDVSAVLIKRTNKLLADSGATICSVNHQQWRERMEITNGDDLMTLDISYKKNGTPSAIEVKAANSTSAEFAKDISSLISSRI